MDYFPTSLVVVRDGKVTDMHIELSGESEYFKPQSIGALSSLCQNESVKNIESWNGKSN